MPVFSSHTTVSQFLNLFLDQRWLVPFCLDFLKISNFVLLKPNSITDDIHLYILIFIIQYCSACESDVTNFMTFPVLVNYHTYPVGKEDIGTGWRKDTFVPENPIWKLFSLVIQLFEQKPHSKIWVLNTMKLKFTFSNKETLL